MQPGEYLLDVGCGWGGLARYAAREFGVKVFGITLSKEQLALAKARVKAEGLDDQVDLQLLDYRDLPQDGRFDKVVSVGMFEHVGHANLAQYCKTLFGAVREGGLVMNHGITAKHTRRGAPWAGGAGDFIERYVFPNGELPHLAMMTAELSEAGLEVVDVESLRRHHLRTHAGPLERTSRKFAPVCPGCVRRWCRRRRCASGGCTWPVAPTRLRGAGLTCTRSWR